MTERIESRVATSQRVCATAPRQAVAPRDARRGHRPSGRTPRAALTTLLALIFLTAWAPPSGAQTFVPGVTPGALAVDQNGQAVYEIPIEVPPGIAGMQPSLSLIYNSGAGNGPLGVGWSLGGLSVIQRCPRTLVQDGAVGGIAYDSTDRFCLDGKRLVAVNGAYGADGTEYRTEIDGFFKVIQNGYAVPTDPESGPAWFRVYTKSGQLMNYGYSADSRIEAVGREEVREWAVNRIQDTAGNYMTLHYLEDPPTETSTGGGYRIRNIYYTGNVGSGVTAQNRIGFAYEPRPDVVSGYVGGSPITQDQRLKAIWTHHSGGNVVRRYQLAYEEGGATGRSRVTVIRECGPPPPVGEAEECLQPHLFTWKPEASGFDSTQTAYDLPRALYGTHAGATSKHGALVDVNGDGLPDLVEAYRPKGSNFAQNTWLNTGSGWETEPSLLHKPPFLITFEEGSPAVSRPYGEFVDVDGDGLLDFVEAYTKSGDGTHQTTWLNTKDGWVVSSAYKPPFRIYSMHNSPGINLRRGQFVDVNGDALVDFVEAYRAKGGGLSQNTWLNTGSGWDPVPSLLYKPLFVAFGHDGGAFLEPEMPRVYGEFVDVNGDGLSDFVQSYKKGSTEVKKTWLNAVYMDLPENAENVWVESPAHQAPVVIYDLKTTPKANIQRAHVVDVNGDGLRDLVESFRAKKDSSPRYFQSVWLSTGAGWEQGSPRLAPPFIAAFHESSPNAVRIAGEFADVNGDGLLDFVEAYRKSGSGTYRTTWLNTINMTLPENTGNIWVASSKYWPEFRIFYMTNDPAVTFRKGEFADINGDGAADFIGGKDTLKKAWLGNSVAPDQLLTTTDSLGAQSTITYAPLTDKIIYDKYSNDVYPIQDLQVPIYVVSEAATDDGLGGQAITGYHYAGAKTHVTGRGFLGFRFVDAENRTTGITTSTFYDKGYPYIGQVLASESYLADGTTLSKVTNTWNYKRLNADRTFFPYIEQSVAKTYEPNDGPDNAPVTTVTTDMTYGDLANPDWWGNPTKIVVTTTHGVDTFVTTTINTYDNYPDQWLLGRLRRAEVTKTLTGGRTDTRVSGFNYHWPTGLLKWETIEPGSNMWQRTEYGYDVFGNTTSTTVTGAGIIDPRTTTTLWTTDGRFPETITNALGHSETRVYDPRFGTLDSQTGPNQITTTWDYDTFGRKVREVRADGTETHWSYEFCTGQCPAGGVYLASEQDVTVDAGGIATPYSARKIAYYDILNRAFRSETEGFDGTPVYADTVFNAKGEVEKVSRPYFAGTMDMLIPWTRTTYDDSGRPKLIIEPLGTETETFYDGLITRVDRRFYDAFTLQLKTQSETRTKNAIGQLVQVRDNLGNTVAYGHDPFGNLETTTVTAADTQTSVVTSMDYDIRGRKISMDDPNMGYWVYDYNALSELISQTDAKGQTVTMKYDLLGRMFERTEAEGTTTWVYDTAIKGIGKLDYVWRSGDDYTKEQVYDSLGRPQETVLTYDSQTHILTNAYDSVTGQLRTLTYPHSVDGTRFAVEHGYTPTGYLETVSEVGGAGTVYWQAMEVNAEGQVTEEHLGNGLVTQRAYHHATGLIQSIDTWNGSTPIQDLTYSFDEIGNLTVRTDQRWTLPNRLVEQFDYDGLNRLSETRLLADGVQVGQTNYAYDGHGNITNKSDVGDYDYSGIDAGPHAVTGAGGKSYAYDPNGAMTSSTDAVGDPLRSVTWSSFNKPVHITSHTMVVTSDFVYGPDRARIRQRIVDGAASKTVYYVGGAFERHDKDNADDEEIHYISAGSTVAIYTRVVNGNNLVSKKTRYLHRDHLGSVDVITKEDGVEVESLSYDAHGKRRQTDWRPAGGLIVPVETPRGFTGHEHLDKLGLIHMNGRVYDPELGRFLSADPFVQFPTNTQSFNRYSYVLNNPLSFTDPSGFGLFDSIGDFLGDVGDFLFDSTIGQIIVGAAIGAICGPAAPECIAIGMAINSGLVTAQNGGSLTDVLMAAANTYVSVRYGANFSSMEFDTNTLLFGNTGNYLPDQNPDAPENRALEHLKQRLAAGLLVQITKAFEGIGNHLDEIQIALSGFGMTPVVGIFADAANALISVLRGDFVGAGFDVATMVPGGGQFAAPFAIAHRVKRITSVWTKSPFQRGIDIENAVAKTTYGGWFRVGKLYKGKFPLVDFQKGNNLVSLKSVDPSSSTAISRMQAHIDALGSGRATVNGLSANMILDVRVPQGTEEALRSLVDYGRQAGVSVRIQGF